uniref:Uncharacterized protein n=1 Tax=Pithovirus LCPAC304 TaxID=2506594 RepID=A0A481Z7I4_9VIRU|nr:MAG: hypothetical protein LCPAC304_01820 [Pithovirus LCPAC304]
MRDLILKSLADQCVEVLLQNLRYVDVSKLPHDLTEKLLYKSCSFDSDDGTYGYHIKEPERSTSKRGYVNMINKYLSNMDTVRNEKYRIKEVYALFEYMVQEKHLFKMLAYENGGTFGLVMKQRLIGFRYKHHLDRVKEYWVQLFDEPFPNKKTQKSLVLGGKSVEELSHLETVDTLFLLTGFVCFPAELQDRLRKALTIFDE